MHAERTIAALSSGTVPAGVAVIRLSGPAVRSVLENLAGEVPEPRMMRLRALRDAQGSLLDRGLVVFFPAPNSFTGEDCAELHVHGSRAVVRAVLDAVTACDGVGLAQAGDFTRRAFEAGKLDLTAVEGLGDLIAAETESQRRQALARASGALRHRIGDWRHRLIGLRAEIEARLDFSDEDDVPDGLTPVFFDAIALLRGELLAALRDYETGRIIRDGFRVVLAGPPNVGKSSLLNALTRSDLAIVTDEEGTTRDVKEVPLDLGGRLVLLTDVAGLRETDSAAEAEGVRRAREAMKGADLVLWLMSADTGWQMVEDIGGTPVVIVATKADASFEIPVEIGCDFTVSSQTGDGLERLMERIGQAMGDRPLGEPALLSHRRDKDALTDSLALLDKIGTSVQQAELVAELLRAVSDRLGWLTGEIDAEAVLDRLFTGFCIGK